MRILIVEDNSEMVLALRRGLNPLFIVDSASSGEEGLHLAEVNEYDAIVLDLSLPDIHGSDLCKKLGKLPECAPILILSAAAKVSDKIHLLDLGASDYVTKPFSLEELRARLRVLVRKSRPDRSNTLENGPLSINVAKRQAYVNGEEVHLRKKEFNLLEYMMHNVGLTVTRSMIIEHVWDSHESIWTNAVDVHIKYIRDKIDRPAKLQMIRTVHGVGYRLEQR